MSSRLTPALVSGPVVETTVSASEQAGSEWWVEITERGGEGVVVKPLDFVVTGRRGLTQPALEDPRP